MARALGITYEGMTGDYAGVTFSSVKMSEDGIFRIVLYRRQNIVAPFCQAVYEAWLEEEIDRGWITFPGGMSRFLEHRAEACRAEWRGSPKPNNDDLKIAKAHQIWHALGVMSSSAISADIGLEYEDTVSEMAREREMREAAGVPEPSFVLPIPSPSSDDPADAADMPPGDGEEEDNADGTAP
jgi:capsid protein